MKTIIILTFVITTIMALPIDEEKPKPETIRQDIINNGDKGYQFDIETSDGSKRSEVGDFKYAGGLTVRGSYEFVDENGQVHKVEYEADEKGFRPKIIE